MTISERIKFLRKSILNLNQDDFSKKIGISRSNVANIEVGRINITDRTIVDICREFNINESWIRNGEGEIFAEPNTFSLDEYLKQQGATKLEIEIVKNYFNIPKEIRGTVLEYFKNKILPIIQKNNL
ncbi:helix-turn-helix domain-containing protein [uncultured Clostridium sp.]|uniref:helix-turn-helix domain-containing protein n=1 Tax=uncultured Clostridium sp. TaxID=59620 RepID=UPI00261D331E|nr:helix-turn-helix transcriptional regulator [uncultured Clostridium sp.]